MKKANLLLWLLLFVIMLAMNVLTPFSVADDGAYAFIKEPTGLEFDEARPITTLSDIVESMINHWYTHTGRIVSCSLESLFIGILGEQLFNTFNALVFCLTIGFFLSLCGYKRNALMPWVVMMLFLILIQAFNETYLW